MSSQTSNSLSPSYKVPHDSTVVGSCKTVVKCQSRWNIKLTSIINFRSRPLLIDEPTSLGLFHLFDCLSINIVTMMQFSMHSDVAHVARVLADAVASECCGQYYWMTIAAGIFGFLMAFGIGANDVANGKMFSYCVIFWPYLRFWYWVLKLLTYYWINLAFATSVSAKSVSLKQAVVIASICEFLGAMLLGASVTSTIKGKILDTDLYENGKKVSCEELLALRSRAQY